MRIFPLSFSNHSSLVGLLKRKTLPICSVWFRPDQKSTDGWMDRKLNTSDNEDDPFRKDPIRFKRSTTIFQNNNSTSCFCCCVCISVIIIIISFPFKNNQNIQSIFRLCIIIHGNGDSSRLLLLLL